MHPAIIGFLHGFVLGAAFMASPATGLVLALLFAGILIWRRFPTRLRD